MLGFGAGTIVAIMHNGAEGFMFLLGLVFGCMLFYFLVGRAKKVEISDKYLYVSNFKKSIKIPITNIKRVSDNILFSPRSINVEFYKETEFGRSITFIAYTQFFLFYNSHPAVRDINMRLKKI